MLNTKPLPPNMFTPEMQERLEVLLPSITSSQSKLDVYEWYPTEGRYIIRVANYTTSIVEYNLTDGTLLILTFYPIPDFKYSYEFQLTKKQYDVLFHASEEEFWNILLLNYVGVEINNITNVYYNNLLSFILSGNTNDKRINVTRVRDISEHHNVIGASEDRIDVINSDGHCILFVNMYGMVTGQLNGKSLRSTPFTDIGQKLYSLPNPDRFNAVEYVKIIVNILTYYTRLPAGY